MAVATALAQEVLQAAGRGESLIAVGADKRPWYSWKKFQTQAADSAQLLRWSRDQRTTAFAVVCGEISGFVVLDFDELGVHLVEEHGLNPHVRTGRGGYHLRVKHPGFHVGTQTSTVTRLLAARWPGLDIRADGGYAIEYGHTEFGEYVHLRDLEDVASVDDLPQDMAAALGLLGDQALDELAGDGEGSPSNGKAQRSDDGKYHTGHRHRHLLEVAGAMAGRGRVEEEILAELRRVNQADCEPPKSDEQLVELARDVAKRYGAKRPTDDGQQETRRLEEVLRLAQASIHIHALRMVGNGPGAAVEIDLSNDITLEAEKFGDLWTIAGLTRFVTQSTGVRIVGMTKAEAEEANALIRRLAAIRYATGPKDLGREHGLDFLRQAAVETFDLVDRASRYEAFARLEALDPVRAASPYAVERGETAPTVAACSVVLQHTDGTRLVHCGWLFSHIRQTGKVAHPGELARRMELAGWTRAGKRGRVKASSPGIGRPIILPFWRVPADWEESL